jgi:uncharacterized membrane protein SpoIIM required for sporulation
MVLEHIFDENWLEQKERYAFVLAVIYSIVGILIATILFPGDPALVAIATTSLLMLPTLYRIFTIEEREDQMAEKFSFKKLWELDKDIVKIYIYIFLGILLVYSISTIILPDMQTNYLFKQQLEIRFGKGFSGQAVSGGGSLFFSLLQNNFFVMLACFIMALLTGDGAIFLITWNASVWGTIFGITAKYAGQFADKNPIYFFTIIMLIVFPHMIIEALSYIFASISGSIISKAILLEEFASDQFFKVLSFNFWLFVCALGTLLLGALVEAWVLKNATLYHQIIQMSQMIAMG